MGMSKDTHFVCLQTASIILNRYQDIEDVLDDASLTDAQKLERVRQLNAKIGDVVSGYLP